MSSPGFPFSIGGTIGTGFNGSSVNLGVSPGAAAQGQSFSTIPLPNTRLALYTLSIRNPDAASAAILSYTFPLSPASISKEFTAMNNVYDVAGTFDQGGVQRVADLYGNSPVTYVIQGTTGWQFHSNDGFSFTGVDSIAAIQNLLQQFAIQNKQRQDANNPNPLTMEFYDYFAQEFWQVVPVGRQLITQNQQRPLLFDYAFRLAGIMNLSSAAQAPADDPILSTLAQTQPQAVGALSDALTITLDAYVGNTAGTLGLSIP